MITVQADHVQESKELEKEVDGDIDAFNEWFQQEGKNDPMTPGERAIIKTYLWFKTHPKQG
jgi:hypothetical protein